MWSCYNFPQKHREFLTFAYGSSQGLIKNANVSALDLGFTLAVGHEDLSRDQNAGIQGLPRRRTSLEALGVASTNHTDGGKQRHSVLIIWLIGASSIITSLLSAFKTHQINKFGPFKSFQFQLI